MTAVSEIRDAANAGAGRRVFSGFTAPAVMRAAFVLRAETALFTGLPSAEKDPRRSIHVDQVPTPVPAPGEALVAVMAAGLNHNTVWSAIFEPEPGFVYLDRYALAGAHGAMRPLDYHTLGSDAAGVVLALGDKQSRFRPGDEVTICPTFLESRTLSVYDDALLDPGMRAWGFETNFGALADFALVKVDQLLPKPKHLTWEEAASLQLASATCYRMLVGEHGARMRQGDIVLVWGAAGGLGSLAIQYVRNGGGIPVCVVSSPRKAELLRSAGFTAVIDRVAEGYDFWLDGEANVAECGRFRKQIRDLVGEDPDIVFEHVGQATFPASVIVPKKGARIVTCASTSGYDHRYDNRYLWMNVRRIIGSHGASYEENWAANRLTRLGMIHPVLSAVVRLEQTADAVFLLHRNQHIGKAGVLCLADAPGLGVRDHELRAQRLASITHFQRHLANESQHAEGQANTLEGQRHGRAKVI